VECAEQAGLLDEPEDEGEEWERRRTVPGGEPAGLPREFRGIRRILVPVAFASSVPDLVRYALQLVRGRGAQVRLFHVVGPPVDLISPESGPGPDPGVLDRIRERTGERLGEMARSVRGIKVDHRVVVGSPSREILAEAAAWKADVIVIGTHGRTGLRRVFLGSVAEAVVRRAPCPVLTVRLGRIPAQGSGETRGARTMQEPDESE
jgi:nucleotide-binding universal stress UspA family protein